MRKSTAKNILMKDGTAKRLPFDQCESLLGSNKARRFISNTVYRAMKLGIEVKDHGTRDDDGFLKKQIQETKAKKKEKKEVAHKAEQKRKKKKKKKQAAEMEAAQRVLDDD